MHGDIIHFAYGNNVFLFVVNVDKTTTYEFQLNHNIDLFKLQEAHAFINGDHIAVVVFARFLCMLANLRRNSGYF